MRLFSLLLFLLVASCGYHFQDTEKPSSSSTITIPYVEGDFEGILTDALVHEFAASSNYRPVLRNGAFYLKIALVQNEDARIGYRFDREHLSGKLTKNLMAVENRKSLTAEVSLLDGITDEVVFGPEKVQAHVEMDYINPDSIRDLTFFNQEGERERVINFSLGQLDSIEGATDDSSVPLYRLLAQKIVDGINRNFADDHQ